MAEFEMNAFIEMLKLGIYNKMPLEKESDFNRKHKNRSGRMRDLALSQNSVIPLGTDKVYFEIGNDKAESETPQYHILEQAEVIAKAGRGTKKTKGTQNDISNLGQRNYAIWTVKTNKKGKTSMFQEYNKNVRGKRSKIGKSQREIIGNDGKTTIINKESKYYVNEHYQYIEKILDGGLLDQLATEFGLIRKRTSIVDTPDSNMLNFGELMLPMIK